jgi:hypothetical protein
MYELDEKFAIAYQQELMRVAAGEDELHEGRKLNLFFRQVVKRAIGTGLNPRTRNNLKRIRRPGLRFVFESKFLSTFLR